MPLLTALHVRDVRASRFIQKNKAIDYHYFSKNLNGIFKNLGFPISFFVVDGRVIIGIFR